MTTNSTANSIGSSYIPPSGTAGVTLPDSYTTVSGMKTSQWTIADAIRVSEDRSGLSAYQITTQFNYISDTYIVTDYGHLRDMHGENVMFNSWYVMWAVCSAKASITPTSKEITTTNQTSSLCYFYSADGFNWTFGGPLVSTAASLYPQVGRCSLVMREGTENTVDVFFNTYNYVTNNIADENSSLAMCYTSGTISVSDGAIVFSGMTTSNTMMIPDGIIYNNLPENNNLVWADPYPFINPGDGNIYCLFTANIAGMFGYFNIDDEIQGNLPYGYNISQDAPNNSSVIGIALYDSTGYATGDFSSQRWTLLNPLISGLTITNNMSRPTVYFNERYTYILYNVTYSDFTNGLDNPSGLYGFYSTNGCLGPYYPLNGCGQVLTNPSTGQTQAASYYCDNTGLVYSSIVSANIGESVVHGGTPSPTNYITFYRNSSYLTNIYNFGMTTSSIDWSTIYKTYAGNSAPWIR